MIENLGTTSQLTEKKCYYIVLCGKEHLSGLSKIPHKETINQNAMPHRKLRSVQKKHIYILIIVMYCILFRLYIKLCNRFLKSFHVIFHIKYSACYFKMLFCFSQLA